MIIAVGQYKDGKELPLKEGDRVIYAGYSSEKINVGNEKSISTNFG